MNFRLHPALLWINRNPSPTRCKGPFNQSTSYFINFSARNSPLGNLWSSDIGLGAYFLQSIMPSYKPSLWMLPLEQWSCPLWCNIVPHILLLSEFCLWVTYSESYRHRHLKKKEKCSACTVIGVLPICIPLCALLLLCFRSLVWFAVE